MDMLARLLNAILMGVILGGIYYNQSLSQGSAKNILGLYFIFVMYQTMSSMFSVLQVFPADVKVFIRENLSGANRVSSYFMARTLSELPNNTIYPAIFALMVYGMVCVPAQAHA